MKHLLTTLFFSSIIFLSFAQTTIGYTNGDYNYRTDGARFGTDKKQGAAIYISKEKAQILKGSKILGLTLEFATSKLTNLEIFISNSIDSNPIVINAVESKRKGTFNFTTPYEITGEAFYIGFTVETTDAANNKPLLFDNQIPFSTDISYVLENNKWGVAPSNYGAINIQMVLDSVPSFTDIVIKPVDTHGFYKKNQAYSYNAQLFNFGTNAINSISISQKIGNDEAIIKKIENIAIQQGETYDFTLPEYTCNETGNLILEVEITEINENETDVDTTDNISQSNTYIYPENIQKKILIECFTGQLCSNCPTGHENLANAIKGKEDKFIEVAHHAGYTADSFTMNEDVEYTWFYGGSTFAPACMFNRTPIEDGASSPVFASTESSMVKQAANAFDKIQPYISINAEANYYKENKVLGVTVTVETHVVPSDNQHTLNIFLTQNNLIGTQSGGGANYVHNHVFRGSLTNVWGLPISLEAGEIQTYYYGVELPDSIASTYTNPNSKSYPVILEDMNVVAFVGDVTSNVTNCPIYNATETKIIETDGTGEVDIDDIINLVSIIANDRQIQIIGDYSYAEVYNLSGIKVDTISKSDVSRSYNKGIYIVRVIMPNGQIETQKICIK